MALMKRDPTHQRRYSLVAFCILLAVAAFYLITEHRAHLLGWLPYAIFLVCPLMHLFMHRSHSHGHEENATSGSSGEHTTSGRDPH